MIWDGTSALRPEHEAEWLGFMAGEIINKRRYRRNPAMSDAGKRLIGAAKEALGMVKSHRSPKVTVEQAQAELPAPLAAEIMHDAWTNFQGIYDYKAIGWGCGPFQSVIGLAIKRGHLKIADATTPDTRDALIKELVGALVNSAATIGAVYQWLDMVEKEGGATSIAGVAKCHAMLTSLRKNADRTEKLIMTPARAALTRAKEAGYGAE